MISKQIGKIRFSVNNLQTNEDIETAQLFFKDFFPLNVIPLFLTNMPEQNSDIEYVGLHKDFAVKESGEEIPEYVAVFYKDDKVTYLKEVVLKSEYDQQANYVKTILSTSNKHGDGEVC